MKHLLVILLVLATLLPASVSATQDDRHLDVAYWSFDVVGAVKAPALNDVVHLGAIKDGREWVVVTLTARNVTADEHEIHSDKIQLRVDGKLQKQMGDETDVVANGLGYTSIGGSFPRDVKGGTVLQIVQVYAVPPEAVELTLVFDFEGKWEVPLTPLLEASAGNPTSLLGAQALATPVQLGPWSIRTTTYGLTLIGAVKAPSLSGPFHLGTQDDGRSWLVVTFEVHNPTEGEQDIKSGWIRLLSNGEASEQSGDESRSVASELGFDTLSHELKPDERANIVQVYTVDADATNFTLQVSSVGNWFLNISPVIEATNGDPAVVVPDASSDFDIASVPIGDVALVPSTAPSPTAAPTSEASGDAKAAPVQVAAVPLGPTAFVTGPQRIVVYQTGVVPGSVVDGNTATPATPSTATVITILDITNFGTSPKAMSMTEFQLLVSSGANPIPGDPTQTQSAGFGFADVQPDGSATVPVDSTIRVAVSFTVPREHLSAEMGLGPETHLVFADERVNISSTAVANLDAALLPPVQPWTGSQGVVQAVPGNGTIQVNIGGTVQDVRLAGVTTPPPEGCFGAESSAAVASLSGGSVWVEDDPSGDGSLVWYWDGGRGHLALFNQALVEQGFGASDGQSAATFYASWLGQKTAAADTSNTGLWAACRGAGGEWINPPTPTPAPTKTANEVRAEYAWPDIRDVVIRPDDYEGEKIAFQGVVFNIPPDQGDTFEFQVYVTTVTGETEAVYVYFEGDSSGIYEGTFVTIYGVGDGAVTGTNAFGGEITQPLVRAEIIDR